jgi:sarcosine oxidase subunit gamma
MIRKGSGSMPDLSSRRAGAFDAVAPSLFAAVLRPLSPQARLILRGRPDAIAAAGPAFTADLPQTPCRSVEAGARAALWLGPDEWLLLAPESDGPILAASLADALAGLPHALVDVSHRNAALEITGPQGAAILNAGCPLDLDLGAFPVGMCTRTVLAKAEIVLWRRGEERFHIEVWRSFAPYVWNLLGEARRELDARIFA